MYGLHHTTRDYTGGYQNCVVSIQERVAGTVTEPLIGKALAIKLSVGIAWNGKWEETNLR